MVIDKIYTLFAPSDELDLDYHVLNGLLSSVSKTYQGSVPIQIKTPISNMPDTMGVIRNNIPINAHCDKLDYNKFIGVRDYYKIQYFKEIVTHYLNPGKVVAFVDADTVIAKPIDLPIDDWDLAFTIRHPWIGGSHYVNLGVWFANIRYDNINRLSWFMQTWLHTPLPGMRNDWANHYQQYMRNEDIRHHTEGNFEFDRIVSQSVINSLCAYDWTGLGTYNWDGLKVLILDERYNYTWKYEDPIRDDVYIYHLKGVGQSKSVRANHLIKEIHGV